MPADYRRLRPIWALVPIESRGPAATPVASLAPASSIAFGARAVETGISAAEAMAGARDAGRKLGNGTGWESS